MVINIQKKKNRKNRKKFGEYKINKDTLIIAGINDKIPQRYKIKSIEKNRIILYNIEEKETNTFIRFNLQEGE